MCVCIHIYICIYIDIHTYMNTNQVAGLFKKPRALAQMLSARKVN